MAALGAAPRWRVTIKAATGTWVREVVAQNEGGAAHVALGGLVTGTEALREHGPALGRFEVAVEPVIGQTSTPGQGAPQR